MTRRCKQCLTPLEGKKSHCIYCSDTCRHKWNNNQAKGKVGIVRAINQKLFKNRVILKELLGDKEQIMVFREHLEEMKFNFKYSTHKEKGKGKIFWIMSYDYGYRIVRESPDSIYLLMKKLK